MKRKLGFYRGLYCGNGRVILGIYGDNGKENGNYYHGLYRVDLEPKPMYAFLRLRRRMPGWRNWRVASGGREVGFSILGCKISATHREVFRRLC